MSKVTRLSDYRQSAVKFLCYGCGVGFKPTPKNTTHCPQCAAYGRLAQALNDFNTRGGDAA